MWPYSCVCLGGKVGKGNLYRCGDWEFRVLEDGSAELTAYWSEQTTLEIPDRIAGYRVSAIGDYCFSNRGEMCFYPTLPVKACKEHEKRG